MKNFLARALALLATLLLLQGHASAEPQDFTLQNKTGSTLYSIYVAPSGSKGWEQDLLGQETLADGESCVIHFAPDTKERRYDILVADEKGRQLEWHDIDLVKVQHIILNPSGVAMCR